MAYCEDYPCCGHTPEDPCERQWYDEPDAFDTSVNPHALCDHESGDCDVWWEEDDEEEEDAAPVLPEGGS
jgi:hypothetical protein